MKWAGEPTHELDRFDVGALVTYGATQAGASLLGTVWPAPSGGHGNGRAGEDACPASVGP